MRQLKLAQGFCPLWQQESLVEHSLQDRSVRLSAFYRAAKVLNSRALLGKDLFSLCRPPSFPRTVNLVLLPKPPLETKPSPAEPSVPTPVEIRTEAVDMTVDEILEHCKQRANAESRDCLYPVEHDAHIDNLSLGIYALRHSGHKTVP